jgi:hypothetical protein
MFCKTGSETTGTCQEGVARSERMVLIRCVHVGRQRITGFYEYFSNFLGPNVQFLHKPAVLASTVYFAGDSVLA